MITESRPQSIDGLLMTCLISRSSAWYGDISKRKVKAESRVEQSTTL